jgi:elongation factor Ts
MADISASTVMEPRSRTGLGMMECKKATYRAGRRPREGGEVLRIKSGARASKAAGAWRRRAAYLAADGKSASMVEVNCETDFVSRNEDFIAFAKDLARLIARKIPPIERSWQSATRGGTAESCRQSFVQDRREHLIRLCAWQRR